MKNEILKTGLSPEYTEQVEGREATKEMEEDVEIYHFILDGTEKRIKDLLEYKDKLGLEEKDLRVVDDVENYIKEIKTSLANVSEQGELFSTVKDEKGVEQSVKAEGLKKVQKDLKRLTDLMSGLDNLGSKVTPSFDKAEGFSDALALGKEQFYDRYFSEKIAKKEEKLSDLIGEKTALFNSGMSAIKTVLEEEDVKEGQVILVGENFYSQTQEILKDYEKKGVKVVRVDTGKTEEVINKMNELKPKFLMLETIANASSMEVADLDRLMEEVKKLEKDHRMHFIIDNTFLTPMLNNVPEKAKKFWNKGESPVITLESATKYYQCDLDNINAGVVYADNDKYLEELKKTRAKIGTNLQGKLATFLPELSKNLWEIKMNRHSNNALFLAKDLEKFSDKLDVSYPGLESHRDHQTLAKEYKGAGGVIYLKLKEELDGEKIINQIKKESGKFGIDINIGGSFGHPETWLTAVNKGTHEKSQWTIRIATGSENIGDFKKVSQVFEKVLQK